MHDRKTIRRRRAVLGLLVASSLVLLTAWFGESAGGGLHSIQRGVGEVFSPIQEGASRSLKPARDLFGWIGDTIDAKGENEELKRERDALAEQVAAAQNAVRENRELKAQLGLDTNLGISDYDPETARVVGQSPTLWFATLKINKGRSDGIGLDMPVVASDGDGAGLVGRISSVTGGSAFVTLITDSSMKVSARGARGGGAGVVEPEVGNPRDLVLQDTKGTDRFERGDLIVTAGTTNPRLPSLFPSGIPIGHVTRVEDPETDAQEVHLEPDVDLRGLEFVRVLTKRVDGEGT
ncbi:rod shape-determining protein MreC [Conexibacter sp. SYSU D00693]|uniref:rod shape-determining protein MreC n=1 Tax=Conexibacter sp. SYSU D00693 TaxID=2812560 RepID=UPI00196B1011|nr:rod shape-determining protein MreC [Conexibacter sp. SYSU D00693]